MSMVEEQAGTTAEAIRAWIDVPGTTASATARSGP